MSKTIKPFDASGWFPIHNVVFDVIMPEASYPAWKVLCVAIRCTWGWVADRDGDPRLRKEWDLISYSQFREKSGISSNATVSHALKECIAKGWLLRLVASYHPGTGKPIYAYALNRDFELAVDNSGASTGDVLDASTGDVHTKQRETEKQSGGGEPSPEHKQIFDLLHDFGVNKSTACKLAQTCNLAQVSGWIEYARTAITLTNPVGLVVKRLQDSESVPDGDGGGGDPHKTDLAQYRAQFEEA